MDIVSSLLVPDLEAHTRAALCGRLLNGVQRSTYSICRLQAEDKQPVTVEESDCSEEGADEHRVSQDYEICLLEDSSLPKSPWAGEVTFHTRCRGQHQEIVIPVAIDE